MPDRRGSEFGRICGAGHRTRLNIALPTAIYTPMNVVSGWLSQPLGCCRRTYSALLVTVIFVGKSADAQPQFSWARGGGGTNHDFALGIAADAWGNSYIAGQSLSPVMSFPGLGTLTNEGSHAILVAKYDRAGNVVWVRNNGKVVAGAFPDSRAIGVVVDGNGNCYAAGVFSGTFRFGATTLASSGLNDLFLAKYDVAGSLVWIQRAGGLTASDTATGARLVIDPSGNICLMGQCSGSVQFSTTAGTNASLSGKSAFLAKYDPAGNLFWIRQIMGDAFPDAIAAGPFGNVFLACDFSSTTVVLDGITLTNQGAYNGLVAKYAPTGSLQWVRQIGGSAADWPVGLGCDASENIIVSAYVNSPDAKVGGVTLTTSNQVLAKMTTTGNLVWAKPTTLMGRVAVEPDGRVFMAGTFDGTNVFGSSTLTNSGDPDAFVANFSAPGDPLWAVQAGGVDQDNAWDLALDGAGSAYFTGEFRNIAAFGSNFITNTSPSGDLFVSRLLVESPHLNINPISPSEVRVLWPASVHGFQLHSTTNLSVPSWLPVGTPPSVIGTNFSVTTTASNHIHFFRLKSS